MRRTAARVLMSVLLTAGAVIAVSPISAADPVPDRQGQQHHWPPKPTFDLDAATIPDIQLMFRERKLTAYGLTTLYLKRIKKLDPRLGAVIALNPLARAEALAADIRRYLGRTKGPLDGIPVLLKDNIDTRYLQTTGGSRALLGAPPVKDAAIVTRLRKAGAVILGKGNLSEWANFRSNSATSGWSGVGLQTNNPYVLDRNPCGSSSGPAVAVAASLSQVAIGTETNGSVVCPAGQNGIVGLKPTLGLASRTGIIPISVEQDTAGPLARHVVDAAITLGALQGVDRADSATAEIPDSQPTDYTQGLATASLQGKRIGVWRQTGIDAGTDAVVQGAVDTIEAAGGTVVEVQVDTGAAGEKSFTALKSEFPRDLAAYLRTRPHQEKTLQQLVDFNTADPVELSRFDQSLFLDCLTAPPASDPSIVAARADAKSLSRTAIDSLLRNSNLDAIMSPTNSPAWKTTYGSGDAFLLSSSAPAAIAGYPNLSVPAGYVGELPVGVSFFGGRWQDASLLEIGAAFEKAADARHAPEFLPTVG